MEHDILLVPPDLDAASSPGTRCPNRESGGCRRKSWNHGGSLFDAHGARE